MTTPYLTPEQVEALDQEAILKEMYEHGELVGRRLYPGACAPKPRARVSMESGRTWVRFNAKPPLHIREALKRMGAQYYRRHGGWLLPAGAR